MVKIDELKNFSEAINGKLLFNYNLKKTNWFNIGGTAKVFFKPDSLNELISFIKKFKKKEKIFLLGAGSNILINDKTFNGIIIKLGKKFSNISLLSNNIIVAGSSATDKKLAEFACENNIGGLEFLDDYILRSEKSDAKTKLFVRNIDTNVEEELIVSNEQVGSPGISTMQKKTNTSKFNKQSWNF